MIFHNPFHLRQLLRQIKRFLIDNRFVMIFDYLPFGWIAIDKAFVFIRFSRRFEIYEMPDVIRITQDFINRASVSEIRSSSIVPIHISALFQIKRFRGVVALFGQYFRYRKRVITVYA